MAKTIRHFNLVPYALFGLGATAANVQHDFSCREVLDVVVHEQL
jgi:hypothetical protein